MTFFLSLKTNVNLGRTMYDKANLSSCNNLQMNWSNTCNKQLNS